MAVKPFGKVFKDVSRAKEAYDVIGCDGCLDDDFFGMKIEPLPMLVDPWLRENNYVMISAQYGIGKTWFNLELATIIAKGGTMGPWESKRRHNVLYFDGEMSAVEMQNRMQGLAKNRPFNDKHIRIINSQMIAQRKIAVPNFTDKVWQDGLLRYIADNDDIKVVFFDNVSSLFPGIDENSKQEWDPCNQFILHMKGLGITPILVHHHGKDGSRGARGTISRLDNVDIHITLTEPPGYNAEKDGAKFIVKFDKARGVIGSAIKKYTLQLKDIDDGSKRLKSTYTTKREEIEKMIGAGFSNAKIAEIMETRDSYVSKIRSEVTQ